MNSRLLINPTCCDGCIGCVRSCPSGALATEQQSDRGAITWDIGRCIFCHRCKTVCPQDAITFVSSDVTFGPQSSRNSIIDLSILSCETCGKPFSFANPARVSEAKKVDSDRLDLCPRCRQRASMQSQIAKKGAPAQ